MFDSEIFTYSQYGRDTLKLEHLVEKLKTDLKRGVLYKKDMKLFYKLRHKLMTHEYDTYSMLVERG